MEAPSDNWLDPNSPEAKRLLSAFDPETSEPIKLAQLRRALASTSRNGARPFPQLLPGESRSSTQTSVS